MPDYKRFVAYIYLYENGIKIKNIGFAKVYTKEGTCRIDIRLRGIQMNTRLTGRVYMFARDRQKLQGIHAGDIKTMNGAGQFSVETAEYNVMESGMPFSKIAGIFIQAGENRVFATEWDDLGVQVKEFQVYQKDGVKAEKTEAEEPYPFVQAAAKEESSVGMTQEKRARENDRNSMPVNYQEPAESQPEAGYAGDAADAGGADERLPADSQPETAAEPAQVSETEGPAEEVPVPEGPAEERTATEHTEEPQEPAQPQERTAARSSRFSRKKEVAFTWEMMQARYRIFPAFEDNEIIDCIRIQPKDLAHLPKKEWVLGNNSFMLHGYYNYKYLLMGKKVSGGTESIVLGVPGVYHNQEKMMAAMFGFPEFKPAKKEFAGQLSDNQNIFGYWCRVVSIEK